MELYKGLLKLYKSGLSSDIRFFTFISNPSHKTMSKGSKEPLKG